MLQQCEEIPKFKINFWAWEKIYVRSSSIILPGFWCQKALKRRWALRRRKNPSLLRRPIPAHVTHNTYVCAYVRFLWSWDGFPIFLVASTLELFSLPEGDGWSAVVFCGRSRHPDERNRWRRSLCSFAQKSSWLWVLLNGVLLVSYWL